MPGPRRRNPFSFSTELDRFNRATVRLRAEQQRTQELDDIERSFRPVHRRPSAPFTPVEPPREEIFRQAGFHQGSFLDRAGQTLGRGRVIIRENPIIGGPFAEPEGPGTSAVERFQTRFGDPAAAAARGSLLAGPLGTEVPPDKRANILKAWWGSEEEQAKAQTVLEEAGWPSAMIL